MSRLVAIAGLAAAVALGAWLASVGGAASVRATGPQTVSVRLGDRIRVVDAPIGCRVVRMRELGRRVVIDCRRAGPLAGTYGTLFTAHEAALVRFKSRHTASLLLVATHNGQVRRCEARR
jgi:hypothetical protein